MYGSTTGIIVLKITDESKSVFQCCTTSYDFWGRSWSVWGKKLLPRLPHWIEL